jgi:hypothetical protein
MHPTKVTGELISASRGRIPMLRQPLPMDEIVLEQAPLPPAFGFVTKYLGEDEYEVAILDPGGNITAVSQGHKADQLLALLTDDIRREINFKRLHTFLWNKTNPENTSDTGS